MGEMQGIIHPGTKFHCICGPVKPEHRLSTSQIQYWDRHRIDVAIPKEESRREKDVPKSPKTSMVNPIRF